MNPSDQSLHRLFRAAARQPEPPVESLPAALATRILARWRAAEPTWLTDWFRFALAGATLVMLLSIAWSFHGNDRDTIGDLTFVNQAIQDDALR